MAVSLGLSAVIICNKHRYIYRDPLEIIASHIKAGQSSTGRGGGAPCLRKRYDQEIKTLLSAKGEDPSKTEAYCAACVISYSFLALSVLVCCLILM